MDRPVKERLIGAVVLVTVAWLLIPVFLDAPPERPVPDEDWVTLPRAADAQTATQPTRRETIVYQQQPEPAPDTAVTPVDALPAPDVEVPAQVVKQASPPAVKVPPEESDKTAPRQSPEKQPDAPKKPAETSSADAAVAARTAAPAAKTEPAPTKVSPAKSATSAAPPSAGGQLWAVQLGSFSDADNAQRLAAKFRDEGLPAFISKVQTGGRTLHRVRIGPQPDRASSDAIVVRLTKAGQAARTVPHP